MQLDQSVLCGGIYHYYYCKALKGNPTFQAKDTQGAKQAYSNNQTNLLCVFISLYAFIEYPSSALYGIFFYIIFCSVVFMM
jgi:hypothetical protein